MSMTQKLSKRGAFLAASLVLGAAFAASSLSAQSVSTQPVGAITQQIAAGSGTGTFTFVGFPLLKAAVWQGPLSGVSGTSLTVAANSLTASALVATPHYVIVTAGANVGLTVDIASNTANTIVLSESVAGLISATDSIAIRPHATLSNLFGATNSAGFFGAGSIATADEIRVFNPTTQLFVNYYYKTTGIGGTGWRSSASTSVSRANDVIYPEQSIVVLRKQSSALPLTVVGEVYNAQFKIPAETGFNWVSNPSPVATSLASSGFYTGSATGLSGSNSITNADEVWRWTGSSWEIFYYKTGGIGGTGWRTTASTSADRGSQSFAAGEPLLVRRKTTPLLLTKPGFSIPTT